MFIHPTASMEFKETPEWFKEKIRDKALTYIDTTFRINFPERLEYEQLSIISWLLAICLMYKNHSEIEWDSHRLYQQAESINRILFSDILEQIYLPLLKQIRSENKSTFDLTSLQQEKFLKMLNKSGLHKDKDIFYDFDGNKRFNFEYISKSLLLKMINRHPNLANCLTKGKNKKYNSPTIEDCFPNFSKRKTTVSDLIYQVAEQLLKENGCCPTQAQIWNTIKTKPPKGFLVEVVDDFLIVDGNNKLTKKLFMKRVSRYTTKKDI
ncbi:hypothetical protein [Legionella bozemanae]|uniref:hypothetical protein n=1 Tax=Legionella bozemanae TaxID=447 RepID=UPI00399D3593